MVPSMPTQFAQEHKVTHAGRWWLRITVLLLWETTPGTHSSSLVAAMTSPRHQGFPLLSSFSTSLPIIWFVLRVSLAPKLRTQCPFPQLPSKIFFCKQTPRHLYLHACISFHSFNTSCGCFLLLYQVLSTTGGQPKCNLQI